MTAPRVRLRLERLVVTGHRFHHPLFQNCFGGIDNPVECAFDHRPLEPGMVLNIEPTVEIPGMTMFTVEDTGIVTEDGFEPFASPTTDLDALAPK